MIFAARRPARKQPIRASAPRRIRGRARRFDRYRSPSLALAPAHAAQRERNEFSVVRRTKKIGEVIVLRRRDREWPISAAVSPARVAVFIDSRFMLAPPHLVTRVFLPERESRRRLLLSAFIHFVCVRLQAVVLVRRLSQWLCHHGSKPCQARTAAGERGAARDQAQAMHRN
ncbi:hypothetical protein LJ656_25865 [Paraburkholderia sp. MMS20-SJTR3]|uniref:Uncharacterized protein n=1 Tax=Paraburkholderia sejongensis TaxID=2886946 RepID=A0ABS8K1P3_9BURK|nr:hypothetical protein [Paraburkholderia sp. MMS20-SJTR3]MCC8396018.1 hypothetical protein [Paraburkholderia sp. MMS20-SJTR3]